MFVRPFTEWHYDAVYDIKFKSYYQMYRIAALLDEQLSENQSRLIRLLEPCNKKNQSRPLESSEGSDFRVG